MQTSNLKQINQRVSIDMSVLLGKGSTGNVYQGLCLEPQPHPVAVKVIPLEQINNQVTSYLLECELEALKATSKSENSSIVKLEEIVVYEGNCYIATELLSGGTLKDYISECKKVEPLTALFILRKMLEGYKILKENGILHRDLKPQNILFLTIPNANEELTPKIIDFGYCTVEKVQKKPKMFYNVGSPRYMSPEAYTSNAYSEKSDMWAIGIIFYEMLTGTNFDKGKNIVETFKLIKQRGIPIPSSLNSQCRKILQQMLMLDPNRRSCCEDVLEQITLSRENNSDLASPLLCYQETSATRNLKELRNTIVNERMLVSPEGRALNPRASWVNHETPLKNSCFLTKSVGFRTSPISRDNQFGVAQPCTPSLRIELGSTLNKSIYQNYKEGSSTERNPGEKQKTSIKLDKREVQNAEELLRRNAVTPHFFNRTLNESASEQNLRRLEGYNHHHLVKKQDRENMVSLEKTFAQMMDQKLEMQGEAKNVKYSTKVSQFLKNQRVLTSPKTNNIVQSKLIPSQQLLEIKSSIGNQKVHFIHPSQPEPQSQNLQQAQRSGPHHIHLVPGPVAQQNHKHFVTQPQTQTQAKTIQQQTMPSQIQKQVQHLFTHAPPRTMPTSNQQTQPPQQQVLHPSSQIRIQAGHHAQQAQVYPAGYQPASLGQNQQTHVQGNFMPEPKFLNQKVRITPVTPQGDLMRGNISREVHFFHPEIHLKPKIVQQIQI